MSYDVGARFVSSTQSVGHLFPSAQDYCFEARERSPVCKNPELPLRWSGIFHTGHSLELYFQSILCGEKLKILIQ